MPFHYRTLVQDHPLTVHESSRRYQLFTERHLQAMWLEQKYFKDLTTTSGEGIEVISPGIWNAEAGPDFLKAHLRIGGQEIKGDIELHLSDEGWEQHGHATDPRYQNVVLHLALWIPRRPKPLVKVNGESMICAYFEQSLTVPLARLVQLIDLDLYPYRKFVGSGRCAQSLFQQMPADDAQNLFTSAALWRLEQKQRFLQARCEDENTQLLAGFAMALGYKVNTLAFLEVFLWLRSLAKSDVTDEQTLALTLGTSGFFQPRYMKKWETSSRYQALHRVWLATPGWQALPHFTIEVGKQRPFNHPVRRLAALSCLTRDAAQLTLFDDCCQLWAEVWPTCYRTQRWRSFSQALQERFPSYEDGDWSQHFLFEEPAKSEGLVLIGPEVKQAVILNALLPMLYVRILLGKNPEEQHAFLDFYSSLIAAGSGKLRYLTHRFFGDTPKGDLFKHAMMEQGAFQLHRDFCIHYESSCEGCPFVERMQRTP